MKYENDSIEITQQDMLFFHNLRNTMIKFQKSFSENEAKIPSLKKEIEDFCNSFPRDNSELLALLPVNVISRSLL